MRLAAGKGSTAGLGFIIIALTTWTIQFSRHYGIGGKRCNVEFWASSSGKSIRSKVMPFFAKIYMLSEKQLLASY